MKPTHCTTTEALPIHICHAIKTSHHNSHSPNKTSDSNSSGKCVRSSHREEQETRWKALCFKQRAAIHIYIPLPHALICYSPDRMLSQHKQIVKHMLLRKPQNMSNYIRIKQYTKRTVYQYYNQRYIRR